MKRLRQSWIRVSWMLGLAMGGLIFGGSCLGQIEGVGSENVGVDDGGGDSGSGDVAQVVLMHYMPWYQTPAVRGRWGEHWTGWDKQHNPDELGEDGLPDIHSKYHPLIGLYDSADPAAIECHLLQMSLAGINGVIVDWYGLTDAADFGTIHEATLEIFRQTERLEMGFAVCYEDRSVEFLLNNELLEPDGVTSHLTQMLEWLGREWFSSPNYVRVNGRPLLMNFGPIVVTDRRTWGAAIELSGVRPSMFGLHHLWHGVSFDGGFTWVHPKPWEGEPDPSKISRAIIAEYTERTTDRKELIVSAFPGFDDVYANSYPSLAYRDGDTLRESLSVGMWGGWPIVQLVTWNDYGEGTMIEPTHEFGYTFLEIVQEARREELGEVFGIMPSDLRLPSRLYALRKSEGAKAESLDEISGLLRLGECERARVLIEAAER